MTTDIFCFYLQNRLIQISQQEVNGTVILPPLVFRAYTAQLGVENSPQTSFGFSPVIPNEMGLKLKDIAVLYFRDVS
jgi:hypothetical protein